MKLSALNGHLGVVYDLTFMLILTTVCTIILTLTDTLYKQEMLTDPVVMQKASEMISLLNIQSSLPEKKPSFLDYFERIKLSGMEGDNFVFRKKPGVFLRIEEGKGMWGKIKIMIAYDAGKKQILGLDILSNSETPGLGTKITESEFLKQFQGLNAAKEIVMAKSKSQDNEFDGITGATISSNALCKIVNSCVGNLKKISSKRMTNW
ncbi:MAG: FMN-binding protein [Candidatus Riflebacteria bacterium]|nr:FMN-binding protein [Candidatus Riflebacteria bacterium]